MGPAFDEPCARRGGRVKELGRGEEKHAPNRPARTRGGDRGRRGEGREEINRRSLNKKREQNSEKVIWKLGKRLAAVGG